MGFGKKGFNSTLFLTVFFFILIVAAVLTFFLTDFFNFNEIEQVNLGGNSTSMNLSNVHARSDGIDFTLNVDPKEKKINGIRFTFETEDNQTKVYLTHISYDSPDKSFFSIDLKEINPKKIKKIIIEPIFDNGQEDSFSNSVENAYNSGGDFTDSDYLSDESSDSSSSSSSSSSDDGSSSSSSSTTTSDTPSTSDDDPYSNVYLDEGLKYGDALDYQCGTRNIDGTDVEYENCPTGYSCNDNLCIASDDKTCTGVTCGNGEYCSHGVCLLTVSGDTYFVALWGNDSNPGTFEEPFYSWQKGAESAYPGDIIYIRGGVWYPTDYIHPSSTIGMVIGPNNYAPNTRSGTKEAPIRYYNYPGEKPIVDGSLIGPSESRWLGGISIGAIEYIYMRGLTVRQIHQSPPDYTHVKPYSEVSGIGSGGANHYFVNMVAHDIDGRGFQHWSYAWNEWDGPDAPFESDNTTWINCDAYNLFDRYSSQPGNAADGWKVGTYYGSNFTWIGCRAWNYSDDGFDPHGSGKRVFINDWAIATNKYDELSDLWSPERNGFKTTGENGINLTEGEHQVIFQNCIAAVDAGAGFLTNLLTGPEYSSRPLYYNNLAYKDGYAYWGLFDGIVKNNIAYGTINTGPIGEVYNVVGDAYSEDGFYNESNNTWVLSTDLGWPPSYDNPHYNVTDNDFVSLNYLELTKPRKADGSLPDVNFGHLKAGSDLIDTGAVIEGYHCATAGAHPGEDCREWVGSAPDLGPFEYDPEGILNY